jgi:hypothetical protein
MHTAGCCSASWVCNQLIPSGYVPFGTVGWQVTLLELLKVTVWAQLQLWNAQAAVEQQVESPSLWDLHRLPQLVQGTQCDGLECNSSREVGWYLA